MNGISMTRVIMKLNAYYAKRDTAGAERHLDYWLAEARSLGDRESEFAIQNERIGHFRKTGEKDKAYRAIREAEELSRGRGRDAAYGTLLVNIGTAYTAFGEYALAVERLEEARRIYARVLSGNDIRQGYACNNTACAYEGMGRWGEAHRQYRESLRIAGLAPGGEREIAVTYLNMARAAENEHGIERAEEVVAAYCEKAYEAILSPALAHDAEYAYVCLWCADEMGRHGFFRYEAALRDMAEEIYEGA